MFGHVRANVWLAALSLLLCCVLYPLGILGIGRTLFSELAEGSLIGPKGEPVMEASRAIGSRLIAQPFSSDEDFQPRPSAVSFNAAASGATNWGANNYLLRDRAARILGPIVKYRGGPEKGKPAGPDIEAWFREDRFKGRPGLVAQWAQMHSTLAQNWIKADKRNGEYVAAWQKSHPAEVAQWIKDNPENPEPKPEDLAVPCFTDYSAAHPGTVPGSVEHNAADGQTEKSIEPVKEGSDIQSIFFDMWRQDHPEADLEPVPADMVMASGSGLDPDITLKNALYQLDRVAGAWASKTHREVGAVRRDIESLLIEKAEAPLGGLAGVKLVNVLEINVTLRKRFESSAGPGAASPGNSEPAATPPQAVVAPPVAPPRAATAPKVDTPAAQGRPPQKQPEPDPEIAKLAAEIRSLKDQVGRLTTAPGIEERLNQKLGELAARFTTLSNEVLTLKSGIETIRKADPAPRLTKEIQTVASRVDSLSEAVKKVEEVEHKAPAPRTGIDLAPAVRLFRDQRYTEALGAFRTLTRIEPDDARTWYYAALANGLATGQWRGETEALVIRGVEREKAGTPSSAQIDAALSDLTAGNGRDWLAYYRKRVNP